jgi:hypothetical protein
MFSIKLSQKKLIIGMVTLSSFFHLTGCSSPYSIRLSEKQLKEDLGLAFESIEQIHPNMYAYTTEEDFSRFREQLYNKAGQSMTRLEFYKALAPVVASLKNGHTFISPPCEEFLEYTGKGGKIFPVEFYMDKTSVFLKNYSGPMELPLGGEVIAIDDQNTKDYLVKFAGYFPSEHKTYNIGHLQEDLPFYLWLEKDKHKSLNLKIRSQETIKDFDIKPLSYREIAKLSKKVKNHSKEETTSRKPYLYRYLNEYETGLIKFDSFDNLNEFEKFLEKPFGDIQKQNVKNLIIDIRNNPGGDSRLGDALLGYLTDKPFRQWEKGEVKLSPQVFDAEPGLKQRYPEAKIGSIKSFKFLPINPGNNPLRFCGRTFVLTGTRTASSAMSFAATVKHYRIGVLIGRETEDTPVNYGHCVYIELPNSKLELSVACKHFVCVGSKDDGRGVLPDYEVLDKPEDMAKDIDTVLQFTLELIKHESPLSQN